MPRRNGTRGARVPPGEDRCWISPRQPALEEQAIWLPQESGNSHLRDDPRMVRWVRDLGPDLVVLWRGRDNCSTYENQVDTHRRCGRGQRVLSVVIVGIARIIRPGYGPCVGKTGVPS